MAATQQPATGFEYRLNMLDLPKKIEEMIFSVQAPSPTDRQYVVDARKHYESTLHAIEAALNFEARNSSQIDSLLARSLLHAKAIARHRIIACTSVLSAWRSLPVELWDMIFASYLDEVKVQARGNSWVKLPKVLQPGRYRITVPDTCVREDVQIDFPAMCAPYPLLSVCQAWKKLVLSTPSVWSAIAISTVVRETAIGYMPFVTPVEASRLVSRIKRIASHHGPWSLNIVEGAVKGRAVIAPQHDLPLSSVFSLAGTPWNSIERLKIDMHPSILPYFGQQVFPSTTSLVLHSRDITAPERRSDPPRVPRLKKAVLMNTIGLTETQISPNIPWAQLTHLLMGSCRLNGERIRGLLQMCTSLHRASFVIPKRRWDDSNFPWTQAQPVLLRSLKSLDVVSPDSHDHLRVPFVDIAFPALKVARIFTSSESYHDAHIAAYLRPFYSLTHLTLVLARSGTHRGLSMTGSAHHYDMGAVLDACPSIVDLVASFQGKLNPFFESIIFRDGQRRGHNLRALTLLRMPGPPVHGFARTGSRFAFVCDDTDERESKHMMVNSWRLAVLRPSISSISIAFVVQRPNGRERGYKQAEIQASLFEKTLLVESDVATFHRRTANYELRTTNRVRANLSPSGPGVLTLLIDAGITVYHSGQVRPRGQSMDGSLGPRHLSLKLPTPR
ncbi:hypothetical protein NMY22_g6790 [Coprinellus aureogranulatus]|nr:hypothetical protein NMY22_g6790 [Coprinellus aureogranulatus]